MLDKGVTHLVADLKCSLAYGGAEPGKDFAWRAAEMSERRFEYATKQTAPARMGGGNFLTITRGEQHGQAVSGEYGERHAGLIGVGCIGTRWLGWGMICHINVAAMHLFQPQWFAGQGKLFTQQAAIGLYMRQIIAHMGGKIESGIRRETYAAAARGLCSVNLWR